MSNQQRFEDSQHHTGNYSGSTAKARRNWKLSVFIENAEKESEQHRKRDHRHLKPKQLLSKSATALP